MKGESAAEREARILARYLFGAAPSSRLVSAYGDSASEAHVGAPRDAFDSMLMRYAMLGTATMRGADLYARLFRPNAWLRRKLVLVIALAEVHGHDTRALHEPVAPGLVRFLLAASIRGLVSVAALALAIPVLAPLHVLRARRGHA